jgi:YidC/Oxa1 family membrane protein insertase
MDLQRTLLIGAIGVLSFMLLINWEAFKETKATATVQETSRLNPTDDKSTPALPEQNHNAPVAKHEDIPAAPDDAATETKSVSPQETAGRNIIQIYTDVLQLAVDLEGGDIIELTLPKYLAELDDPNKPFVLLEDNTSLVYVAQSGLIGSDGIDNNGRAKFTAAAPRYELVDGEDTLVVDLHWEGDDKIKVTKRLTMHRGSYLVDVDYLVENNSTDRWEANLFGQIKRGSAPPPSVSTNAMGMHPFLGFAVTQPDDRFTKLSFKDLAEESFKAQIPGGWIAMIQHYFLSAWIPDPDKTNSYSARVTPSGYNIGGFTSPALVLDPGKSGQTGAKFYAGPKDQYSLKEISPYLELSVDYGFLWWIAQPLFWLLTKIYSVVGNWGVAIILLTVLIKAVFFKLSAASYRSMANMRRVQPKLMALREQYADDKQKQSQAMMELYKKEKINPMGGCLPILVQMPVFIGLYWMLMESVELRQAPFILWIKDLSVMDPYFVLPLMMGASMYYMQKLNPPPPDPMQAKIMQWMPVMFTFFFLWFPAGLVLYWVVNNLLSMAQQYVITRQIEKAAAKS